MRDENIPQRDCFCGVSSLCADLNSVGSLKLTRLVNNLSNRCWNILKTYKAAVWLFHQDLHDGTLPFPEDCGAACVCPQGYVLSSVCWVQWPYSWKLSQTLLHSGLVNNVLIGSWKILKTYKAAIWFRMVVSSRLAWRHIAISWRLLILNNNNPRIRFHKLLQSFLPYCSIAKRSILNYNKSPTQEAIQDHYANH